MTKKYKRYTIEREVKQVGSGGYIYLPREFVGETAVVVLKQELTEQQELVLKLEKLRNQLQEMRGRRKGK